MTIDLTGGLPKEFDYVFSEVPETPEMREAVNIWVWDDSGEIGFPRFAVEAVAPEWDQHELYLSVAFPDGRLLRNWSKGPSHPVLGPSGEPTVFGAGPLEFHCIEPFAKFRTVFDGDAVDATFDEMVRPGFESDKRSPIKFEIDYEPVVPPFIQGTLSEEAKAMMASGTEADFMGGDRLEQLCRARGRVTVDGVEREFTGGALRIRRRGVRKISGFWGHCWQSAVFPSGKAFGYIAYPPRADGSPSYNEGFVFLGDGELLPARVVKAPWLTHYQYSGEDVSAVIETPQGEITITAESTMGMPSISRSADSPNPYPHLFQSIARYKWDGEEALGMMERSSLPERVTLPA